jgi:hypothetical protein
MDYLAAYILLGVGGQTRCRLDALTVVPRNLYQNCICSHVSDNIIPYGVINSITAGYI